MDFIYQGEQTMATLRLQDSTEQELLLRKGTTYTLPADHPWVADLVEQKLFVPAPVSPPITKEGVTEGSAAAPVALSTKKGGANA